MNKRTRRRAVTAGAAASLVAGAALGILQVIEQTIGAWHPRPVVSALIVIAAFFTGLWAAGLRTRRVASTAHDARDRQLSDLLASWPAASARNSDPVRLGVFPMRRDLDPASVYIPRDIDDRLRGALVDGAVVVVCGQARAGASRTAFEAARSAVGEAVLLAPRSGDSLRELASLELDLGDRHVLVWLDGLDRYVAALDSGCVGALRSVSTRVTILATLRAEVWDEWLRAVGAAGGAGRALAADARVFEISTSPSNREAEAAGRLYPGIDFSLGIGSVLASRGRDSEPPPIRPPEQGEFTERDPQPPWWRAWQVAAPAAAAMALVVALLIVIKVSGFTTPSIDDQIAADEREGSRHNRHAAFVMKADLHGSGEKSWIVLFRDDAHPPQHSDELRIYDEHGAKLVRALRFAPAGPPALFQKRAVTDVDFDGSEEIVGGYAYANESNGAGAMVPFAIDWDRARERYVILSLDHNEPSLSEATIRRAEQQYFSGREGSPTRNRNVVKRAEEQYRQRVYSQPTAFKDPGDHYQISGYRVQDFAVSETPHRLIVGWYLRPLLGESAIFELHTAIFDDQTGAPHLTPCSFTGLHQPLVARVGTDRLPYKVFEETYAVASRNRGCDPRYNEGL